MYLYFTVYALIGILRLSAFLVTGYFVLLAEFFHGIIDVLILAVLKKAKAISEKPPDEHHPFGHGLAENIGALTVSIAFITLVSFEIIREGFGKIMNPGELNYPELAIVILFSTLALLVFAIYRAGKREGHVFSAVKTELKNDILSTSGAVMGVALSGVYPFSDGIFSIFIGFIIAYNGIRLYTENANILMGFSPEKEFYSRIETIVGEFEEVEDVHDLSAVFIGNNKIHLDMHVTVDGEMKVRDADELSSKISQKIRRNLPEVEQISVHFCSESSGKLRKVEGD